MNLIPVFYILFIIGLILLWFLLAILFKPIGIFVHQIFKDVSDIVSEETVIDNNKTNNTKKGE